MEQGRVIILTGCPGTGKSTVAALVAERSALARSVLLQADDFYEFLCKGALPPYLPQAQQQNQVLARALAAAANSFALGGYDVVVDGVVGPWLIEPWLQLAREGRPVHYILLRAGKEETMARALGRDKLDKSLNARLVEVMWEQFQGLGAYEPYGLDTTRLCAEETARLVLERVESKKALLPPGGEG